MMSIFSKIIRSLTGRKENPRQTVDEYAKQKLDELQETIEKNNRDQAAFDGKLYGHGQVLIDGKPPQPPKGK